MKIHAPVSRATPSSSSARPRHVCSSSMRLRAERPTEWTQDQFNTLIDSRACKALPTWFTTNCSLEELEHLITPRTYSRLVYEADVLEVTGPDLRKLCR